MKGLFSSKNKKVHLCLSGGGALGFAHIGVIQALEENGIYATHISGASMGAIIGAFYAAGIEPEKMLKLIREDKLYKLSKLLTFHTNFWRRGLSDQTTLKKLIHELIPHNSFEGLEKKLYVCVSNMNKADAEIICSGGDLDKWIAASASIPAIFELVNHQNTLYLDGGFMNNMPAQCFEKNYNSTIGVDVLPYKKINLSTINGVMDTAMTTVRAMQCKNSQEGRDICTYLIEPFALEKYNEFSYEAFEEIYKIGYNEAIKYIKENRDILNLKNS